MTHFGAFFQRFKKCFSKMHFSLTPSHIFSRGRAGVSPPPQRWMSGPCSGPALCPKEVSEDLAIEAAMDAEVDDVFVKEGEDGEWLVVTEPKSLSALKAVWDAAEPRSMPTFQ